MSCGRCGSGCCCFCHCRSHLPLTHSFSLSSPPSSPLSPSSRHPWFVLFSCAVLQGVQLSHRGVVAVVAAILAIVPNGDHTDVYFAYLPLAHILELTIEVGARRGGGTGNWVWAKRLVGPLCLTHCTRQVAR